MAKKLNGMPPLSRVAPGSHPEDKWTDADPPSPNRTRGPIIDS